MKLETGAVFMRVLQDNRLLEPEQLRELDANLVGNIATPRTLAKYLMQRGWLTVYQTNQILEGNGNKLTVGPYRILQPLGEGGLTRVFKAWDTREKRPVALKILREELLDNPEALGRFRREIHAVTQLCHPHIVKAYADDIVRSQLYFAMEYLEGNDLAKTVRLSGPLAPGVAASYVHQAALGLDYAHEHQFIHRDIKPGNLFLTSPRKTIKILDLGLTRLPPEGDHPPAIMNLTREGTTIGTPDYVAPEQAQNPSSADARSDVYSLGCTLYFLLTGQPPFPVKSAVRKLAAHQEEMPRPVMELRPEVPPALAALLSRMMAKKPEGRQQTAGQVAKDLEACWT
jgi:serine/threonine-protein kinase